VLAHPDAVVGYGAAALLHGLATYRPCPRVELVRARACPPRRTPDLAAIVVTVADLPPDQASRAQGVPATPLARTAADIARRGSRVMGVS